MDYIAIIANVLGFIGMGLFFITSALKNKKIVLSIQSVGHVFNAVTEYLTNSKASIVQEVLCWIRDMLIVFKKDNKVIRIILILLIVGVGVFVNYKFDNNSIFGYLVIFANLVFTIDIFYNNKNVIVFKFVSAFSNICWMLLFLNTETPVYTSAIFNGIAGLINITVGIVIFIKYRKKEVNLLGNKIEAKEEETEIVENL